MKRKTSRYTHGGRRPGAGPMWKTMGFLRAGNVVHVRIWKGAEVLYQGRARLSGILRENGINIGVLVTPDQEFTIRLSEKDLDTPVSKEPK